MIGANSGERNIDTHDKKRLMGNFASLSVLQGANYILPFVTVPYLTRVLGPAHYGLIGFAAAFVNYFTILTGYGFHLSATREISLSRDDRERISRIFSAVMIIKAALLALSAVIVLAVVYSFDKFRTDAGVYLVSFGIVAGNVLFPVWLFQGMERMKYITYINLAGRAALTAAVFVFISAQADYVLYVILSSVTSVLVGVASLVCAMKVFRIEFATPSFEELRREAVEGWYVFVSSISVVLYTSSTTFVLGLFTNNAVVGYYTGADKIRQAVQGLFTPVLQTLYPYVNKLAHESRERAVAFMQKEALYLGIVGGLVCLFVFAGAGLLVRAVLGAEYAPSVALLRILAFAPALIVIGNVLTVQGMLSLNLTRDYSIVFVSAGIVGIAAIVYLTHRFAARGTALSVVVVEAFAIALALYRMRANGIDFFRARESGT